MGKDGRTRSARFAQQVVRDGAFAGRPFVVVDVGARGGFSERWSVFGDQIEYVGFEPDAEECERVNAASTNPRARVYPFALHRDKGTHPFYVAKFPNASGFYPIDPTMVKGFPISEPLSVDHVTQLKTTDFDSFAGEHGIGYVDFMKLDTEGSELDILEGAARTLNGSVLGVSSEALFTPWHTDQRVFADLDGFLRSNGFVLYDLPMLKFARSALPSTLTAINPATAVADYGQVIVGDALYLRDAVRDIESGRSERWDEIAILKMVCLYELFYLPDCAIELLRCANRHGLLRLRSAQVDAYCDLIVMGFAGKTYDEYMRRFGAIERRGHVSRWERLHDGLQDRLAIFSYYWRLVREGHPPSWYHKKLAARLARRPGM